MSDYVRAGDRMRKDSLDDGVIVDIYIHICESVLISFLPRTSSDKSLRTFITSPMVAP